MHDMHMQTSRRGFLERLTVTTAATAAAAAGLAALPSPVQAMSRALGAPAAGGAERGDEWDTSWARRVNGKYRAVFDVPEIDSAYGVWRASLWAKQYADVLKAQPKEMTSAVVLRHNGIYLAMQQAYWDKYGTGAARKATHPLTEQPTDRNPALLADLPEPFNQLSLDKYLARGGIALACNLALQDVVAGIQEKEKVSPAEARKQALAWMVPGVILQPSGVFAALYAQDAAGCKYIRAS